MPSAEDGGPPPAPRTAVSRMMRRLIRSVRRAAPRSLRHAVEGFLAAATGHPALLRHLDLSAGLARRQRDPRALFVGWLLKGDGDDGAARVNGLIQHRYFQHHFRHLAVNSVLLRAPGRDGSTLDLIPSDLDRIVTARFDVVIFHGVHGPAARELARILRATGTRTIYVAEDLFSDDMAAVVDWVVSASEALTAKCDRSSVIEPAIESPLHLVKDHSRSPRGGKIRVVWVGDSADLHLLAPVHTALADPRLSRFELVTISRGPGVTHQWHRRRVWRQLLACDIAVLPAKDTEWSRATPSTPLVMFKALGLPSVASPVASYCETLTHGQSCYFARTPEEWATSLLALSDRKRRREIGLMGRKKVLGAYSVDAISRKWLGLFRELCADAGEARLWGPGASGGHQASIGPDDETGDGA